MKQKKEYIYNAVVTNVVDGDTFDVSIDLGFNVTIFQRVRLYEVDAYETSLRRGTTQQEKQKGIEAKYFLTSLLENKPVVLETIQDKQGKYGRYLAKLFINGTSVGDILKEKEFVKS